jgi:hypothetical protein
VKYAARRIVLAEFDVVAVDPAAKSATFCGSSSEPVGSQVLLPKPPVVSSGTRSSLRPAASCQMPRIMVPELAVAPRGTSAHSPRMKIAILAEAAAEDVRELHPFVDSQVLQACPGDRSVFALAWRWLTGN